MPLRLIPARGGWVGVWLTPAWAATVRPTISAVAAMLSTAVIQRRIRRVIVTSLIRLHPAVRDHRWFEAAAAADGYPPAGGHHPAPARRCRAAAPPARRLPAHLQPHAGRPGPGDHRQRPAPRHLAGDHDALLRPAPGRRSRRPCCAQRRLAPATTAYTHG